MMNLSFAGCGFLGIYHVGVASCFREYAPHLLVTKIAGASVGSIAAAALICDVSLGQTTTDILSIAVKARSRTLGPLNPRFDLNSLVKENLEKALPLNAHELCNNRLFISVTRSSDKQNVLLSQYDSREELIQALLCSCFIPLYSGMTMPVFRGVKYVDGGLSDNLPVLDENTITVSPFAGEHDICPEDESCNILQVNLANTSIAVSPRNIYRLCRILFPPKPEILSKMCQQGFDDALKFLQRKNLIACTRCLGVQSSLSLAETESESSFDKDSCEIKQNHDNCSDCTERRKGALIGNLPECVVDAIQQAVDQMNKGNWVLQLPGVKLLRLLGAPYILPLDVTTVIFWKVWQQLPSFRKEILAKFDTIISLTKYLLNKIDKNSHLYSAKFSCQLAITEFDYTEDNVTSSYALPTVNRKPHETCIIKTEDENTPKRKMSVVIKKVEENNTPKRKVSTRMPDILNSQNLANEKRQQRKSYAGFTNSSFKSPVDKVRRKSLSEVSQPERVIKNMKFAFTVDLVPTITKNDKKTDVVEALKSLGEEDNEVNVVDLANKALSMERKYITQCCNEIGSDKIEDFEQIINAPNSEAVMSYYYVEDKTVKITELYNVTDADTSIVLPDEERKINDELQWEKDWINVPAIDPAQNVSITDTLDDDEFDTSDVEYDLPENLPSKALGKENVNLLDKNEPFISSKPQRKTSFIIVN
ncbi:patatin-like phospholipase domain-containing protein 2 [Stegodyphus dumicola]|uniref:patatin-like phospholipase domain-containing protein 2 n=1 Tax=Stegodyphus dumicola TaxID=202533 RepID=UPI0015B143B8|nr:patatin-like phospholipase domain-containing protein 2 [Stegodyphus dumicola]